MELSSEQNQTQIKQLYNKYKHIYQNRNRSKPKQLIYHIKMQQGTQSTELNQRDDYLQFNDQLSKSTHNIKKLKNYKKFQIQLSKRQQRLSNPTQCTYNQTGYIRTIDNSQRVLQDQRNSLQRIKLNLDSLQLRRNSVTASNTRRKNNQSFKSQNYGKTLNISNHIHFRQPDITQTTLVSKNSIGKRKQNKCKKIQLQMSKGPLKEKNLIVWLNSLLLEACQNQKFDGTIQNAALKKYNIDENSLKSKGIRPQNLHRIYKSLFVYSIGFNDLLKQICGSNMNLRKTIWKVYAVLLDYCAEGNFQTMINEIKKQNREKIDVLTDQLLQKQKQIQSYDQTNEKKNEKIYKEIKRLIEQNKELKKDYQNQTQQLRLADQAFNQQVTLRLKFQNRINEVHGIYVQLQNKHERIKHNFQINNVQLQKLRLINNAQVKQITDLKAENESKAQQINILEKKLKYKTQLNQQLESKKLNDGSLHIQHINTIKDLKSNIQQNLRHIGQLTTKTENANLMYESQRQQRQSISRALSRTLEQNSRLYKTIQQQMESLNQLLMEKRDFGLKTSQIQAQASILDGRLKQRDRQIKNLKKYISDLEQRIKNLQKDIDHQIKLKLQLQSDLKICHASIKQMKNAKNSIEQQHDMMVRRSQAIDEIINAKDTQISQQKMEMFRLNQQLSSSTTAIKTLQSTLQQLRQKLKSSEQTSYKKYMLLKKQKQTMEQQYTKFMNMRQALQSQRDQLKAMLTDFELKFKNQKFERTNLNFFYQSALKSIQQKSDLIKRLDMTISQCQEDHNETRRKLKNLQYVSEQKQKNYQKQRKFWDQKVRNLTIQSHQRTQFIHPMIFEDVAQNFQRKSLSLQQLKAKTQKKMQELNKIIESKHNQLKQLIKTNEQQKLILISKYQSLLSKKQNQILYQTNKNSYLVQQKKQLQHQLLKYTGNGKQLGHEKQQKYLNDIHEKKSQIQTLLKDLQNANDANQKLRDRYMNFETKLVQKQELIEQTKQKLEQKQKQYEQHLINKEKYIEQKVQELLKIRQAQSARKKQLSPLDDNQETSRDRKKTNGNYGPFSSSATKRTPVKPVEGKDFARKLKNAVSYYNK